MGGPTVTASTRTAATVARWSLALLLTGVAGWVWLALNPILSERYPLLPFYPAVFVVAWFGGVGPGVLATFLGAFIVAVLSLPSPGGLLGGSAFGFAAFLSIGLSTSGFGELYQRAQAYLDHGTSTRRTPALSGRAAAAIAVTSVAVFGGMIYAAGDCAGLFEPSETLHARFADADGLRAESVVRLAGVPVGRVVTVDVGPAGDVRVDLRVARRAGEHIRQDSVARIASEQLLGRKCVEIVPGKEDAPPLADGAELATRESPAFGPLVDQASDALRALQQTAENLRRITAQIERGHGTLGEFIENRELYDRTIDLVEKTRTAVGKLEARAEK